MLQQQLEGLSQEGWSLLAGRSWGNRHPPLKAPTPNWFLSYPAPETTYWLVG